MNTTKDIIIIGSGGHAKVVIDILKSKNEFNIIGCIAKSIGTKNVGSVLGVPIIGDDDILGSLFSSGVKYAFVAIGDNKLRKQLTLSLLKIGFEIVNVISGFSYISNTVKLGKGIVIMPGVVINSDSLIDDGCIINTNSSIDHDCKIDKFVHVGPGSNLAGNVLVNEGVFLGIGCKIIPRINIGEWAIVGAGGIVVSKVTPFTLVKGVPAK